MASLGMLTILVDEYDRGIGYFTQALGFSLLEDTRLSSDKRWVVVAPDTKEGARMLLARASSPAQVAAVGNQTGGRVGFFLYTNNFDNDYSLMRTKGVNFIETPRQEPFGKVVVFKDIFGNKWDFIERVN
jgi:hypothetical protein